MVHVLTREELYEAVWEMPHVQLAKEYGVSDVAVAKMCKRMEVPRPPQGYWRKREVGKKVPARPPLRTLSKRARPWVVVRPHPKREPLPRGLSATVLVSEDLEDLHPLAKRTLSALSHGRPDDRGIIVSKHKRWLDVRVSKDEIERACKVYDALIHLLESRGYEIRLGEAPGRNTSVLVNGESVRIELRERYHRRPHIPDENEGDESSSFRWYPNYDHLPSGELFFCLVNAPYGNRREWSDRKTKTLESQLGEVVHGFEMAAKAIHEQKMAADAERVRREEWEREQAERRRLQRIEGEKIDALLTDVAHWRKTQDIREYLAQMEMSTTGSRIQREWFVWAKKYADEIDPLVPK